jgi:hypothetical protein
MAKPDSKKEDEQQYPDAWSRFERAIDVVVKSPPQHRARAGKSASRQKSKKEKIQKT